MGIFGILFTVFASANTSMLAIYNPQTDSQDFAQLQALVSQKSFENPEDFLITWKKEKPDYFSNYVLAYRSRSLQKSSFANPRALIFNTNADLVIAFNGDKTHKGYNNLELMHFNHDTKSFEFHEMSFERGKAKLSEANPKKCLACHQSVSRTDVQPRPNWEPYNTWPGFYGSLDDDTDLFMNSAKREMDPVDDALILKEIEIELQKQNEFRKNHQSLHPRYSLLSGATTDQYNKEDATLNGDLTNRLAVLNFKRVAKLIRTLPQDIYAYTKWAVWAHAKCGMTLYMENDVFEWLYSQVPNKDLARRTVRRPVYTPGGNMGFWDEGVYYPPKRYTPPQYKDVDASDVINVLFESAGVSTEDWSMDFKTDGGKFAAFERFGVTNDPRPPWQEAIKRELSLDPDLKDMDCEQAKLKSLENFSNLEKVQKVYGELKTRNPKPVSKPLINRCVTCHSNTRNTRGDFAPVIPFHDPLALKSALQKGGYTRGTLMEEIRFRVGPHATEDEQMPKGAVPTSAQVDELLRYLESL